MENKNTRAERKVLVGIVTSDKMNKTRTVEVTTTKKHSFYGKIIRTTKSYHAHDEGMKANLATKLRLPLQDLCQNLKDGAFQRLWNKQSANTEIEDDSNQKYIKCGR